MTENGWGPTNGPDRRKADRKSGHRQTEGTRGQPMEKGGRSSLPLQRTSDPGDRSWRQKSGGEQVHITSCLDPLSG